jgi:hypothetical protein
VSSSSRRSRRPVLTFAGLSAALDGSTDVQLGTYAWARWYGTDPKNPLPPVISIEVRGTALAFVRPGSVRFPLLGPLPQDSTRRLLERRAWLSLVVADNGLGTAVTSVRVNTAPGVRRRLPAIDGDPARLASGTTYTLTEHDQDQERTA